MPYIDPDSPVITETSDEYWSYALANKKILLHQVQSAILALTTAGLKSYTINSGQNIQTVTREDISNLKRTESTLLSEIRDLELKLGVGDPGIVIVNPDF